MPYRSLTVVMLLTACNEYGIDGRGKVPEVVETDAPVDTDPVDTDLPTCADVQVQELGWRASTAFTGVADPVDSSGNAFWSMAFDDAGLSAVTLPDIGQIPPGHDRAYRGQIEVRGEGPRLWLDMQSDDGIIVWIDGVRVGQWGGAHQQEGCVNDEANCLQFVLVEPVDVTDPLGPGVHTLAARVSNPVEGSYADVEVFCRD